MAGCLKDSSLLDDLAREDGSEFSIHGKLMILLALFALLVLTSSAAVVFGAYKISITDVYSIILSHLLHLSEAQNMDSLKDIIVWDLRLPRVLLAITVGFALSAAGATFQGCFRNPLVEPYILGISSGAAFGAAMGIVFHQFFFSVQAAAFIFGSLAVIMAYGIARVNKETPTVTLILAGVILGSLFSAAVSILKYISNDSALREIVFWLMGGFYFASWSDVALVTPVVMLSFLAMWSLGWKLNILSMGDDEARGLGVNPEKYKLILIGLATLMTSIAVSTVGIIAWVGLMMPHATRMILGPDHRFVIPASAMLGGSYLLICDTMARTLTSSEIPVGIITSLLGAPYLVYLLRTRGKSVFE